jgi:diguanylate cyclase (GGDEF)-like protein/PAS domain S-box-containing protein
MIDVDEIHSPAFSLAVTPDGRMTFAGLNGPHTKLTGLTKRDVFGLTPHECLPAVVADAVLSHYRHCRETNAVHEYEEELALPAGSRWWRTTLTPLVDAAGAITGILGMCLDIDERKRRDEDIHAAAFVDVLTGIPNRRRFEKDLERRLLVASETSKPFTIVTADVDRFKSINDRLGHAAGDEVLRQVARRFREATRMTDTVARLGGDEFVAIISAATEGALSVALDRLRRNIVKPVVLAATEVPVSVSFGAALWSPGRTAEEILSEADMAMYACKEASRSAEAA